MARYTGADCRLCRREGAKLFLKGDRCYTDKCAMERRAYAPGEAGQDAEGMQIMRTLARNMSFLVKSIALGRARYGLPEREDRQATNFIR